MSRSVWACVCVPVRDVLLQANLSGFEPKRFYSIVEFLLMDRDCSGEISLDEAMTTLFERQGADNLGEASAKFFRAAGVLEGDEPPPGATITFGTYYHKIGLEKPSVPSRFDLRRSFSGVLRQRDGKEPTPALRPSASAGLLPKLLNPRKVPLSIDRRATSPLGARAVTAASPTRGRGSCSGGGGGSKPSTPGALMAQIAASGLGATRPSTTPHRFGGRGSSSAGALIPLKPIQPTGGLAETALSHVGTSANRDASRYKQRAAHALKLGDDGEPLGTPPSTPGYRRTAALSRSTPPRPPVDGLAGGSRADMA